MHPDPFDCADHIVFYDVKARTYGIIIHDGGSSFVTIAYCPWCGTKLHVDDESEPGMRRLSLWEDFEEDEPDVAP